jgi:hypothetical protein
MERGMRALIGKPVGVITAPHQECPNLRVAKDHTSAFGISPAVAPSRTKSNQNLWGGGGKEGLLASIGFPRSEFAVPRFKILPNEPTAIFTRNLSLNHLHQNCIKPQAKTNPPRRTKPWRRRILSRPKTAEAPFKKRLQYFTVNEK